MNNQKIALSALVATALLTLSGCGGGGGASTGFIPPSDGGGTDIPVDPVDPITPIVVDPTVYSGPGADQVAARHQANDAAFLPVPAYDEANVVTIFGDITVDTLFEKGKQYKLSGLVTVKNGAKLIVEAGAVVFGDTTGDDYLVIAKGSQIEAIGTEAEPIIFTSEIALKDPLAADVGQWGGLTILGDAPTNRANPFYEVDESNPDFAFGGANAADDSGILKHVYILNSGVTMSTDQEVNGLSLAGVGSGTTIDNITVINSSDDGVEIWGGTVDVTNITMINCQDDSFDLDYGYVGNATNIKVVQTDASSHAGFEISSGGDTPMTSPTITNFSITKVDGSDEGGIYIKDDTTAPTFINGAVATQGADAGIFTKVAFSADQTTAISFEDVLFNSPTQATGAGAADALSKVSYPVYNLDNIDTVTLSGDITANLTLDKTKQYKVNGLVTVKNNAVLTVPAGTVVYGDSSGDDFIVIAKGSQIIADGTDAEPIYFTSEASLTDPTSNDVGQWGGLTVLGDAPINRGSAFYEVDESNPDFAFGGSNAADDSGVLRNVYIMNSGVTMSTDQEVNGLSLAGVGSGTIVDNVYVGNSSDDGVEIWGGTVDVNNLTMVNCQDDSFDLDYGYVGTATNIFVQQTDASSHAGFEISSGGDAPMTSPVIRNFVINKAGNTDEGGIYIKDDTTAPTFVSGLVTTISDANINTKQVFTTDQTNNIAFRDVLLLKP